MKSCIMKSKLYCKYCNNKTDMNKDKYLTYRKHLTCLLYEAEKSFYHDKFKLIAGNTRETWKLLGSILNKNMHSDLVSVFNVNGVEIYN